MWYLVNERECIYMDKEKKKIILIVTGVILVIVLACLIGFTMVKKDDSKETTKLQDILNDSLEIKTFIDEEKNIELTSLEKTLTSDEVKVWVFSEPVYLGKFKLLKKDDKYYLEGLNEVLKEKNLEAGNHRLLVMQNDKSLGYIGIEIMEDKSLKSMKLNEPTLDNKDNNNTDEATNESGGTSTDTNGTDTNKNQTNKTESNKNTSSKNNKKEETTKPANKTEEVKEEPKKEETLKEEPKQEEVKCTPKKFKNKYTYFYEDKDTCVKNGDHQEAWDYFKANGISAYTYGCEKIIDDCGKTYYGVYYGNMEGEKYYY